MSGYIIVSLWKHSQGSRPSAFRSKTLLLCGYAVLTCKLGCRWVTELTGKTDGHPQGLWGRGSMSKGPEMGGPIVPPGSWKAVIAAGIKEGAQDKRDLVESSGGQPRATDRPEWGQSGPKAHVLNLWVPPVQTKSLKEKRNVWMNGSQRSPMFCLKNDSSSNHHSSMKTHLDAFLLPFSPSREANSPLEVSISWKQSRFEF